MGSSKELYQKTEQLLFVLMSVATGGGSDGSIYRQLRSDLIAEHRLRDTLPEFVRTCRDIGAFWSLIKSKFGHYEERRQYLRQQFEPALMLLEK